MEISGYSGGYAASVWGLVWGLPAKSDKPGSFAFSPAAKMKVAPREVGGARHAPGMADLYVRSRLDSKKQHLK